MAIVTGSRKIAVAAGPAAIGQLRCYVAAMTTDHGQSQRRSPHTAFAFRSFRAWWDDYDRHRTWTGLALIGIPLAILLAVFGQPPIGLKGPLYYLGIMGPTSGMTRGVMWMSRGNVGRAWMFNPASLAVLPSVALVLVRAAYGRLTGRWLSVSIQPYPWLLVLVMVAVLALAVRQQLQVDLLLQNPAG